MLPPLFELSAIFYVFFCIEKTKDEKFKAHSRGLLFVQSFLTIVICRFLKEFAYYERAVPLIDQHLIECMSFPFDFFADAVVVRFFDSAIDKS